MKFLPCKLKKIITGMCINGLSTQQHTVLQIKWPTSSTWVLGIDDGQITLTWNKLDGSR